MRAPISHPGTIADPNHLSIPVGETFTIHARNVILPVFVDDKLIPEGYALGSMSDEPLYAALMSPVPRRRLSRW